MGRNFARFLCIVSDARQWGNQGHPPWKKALRYVEPKRFQVNSLKVKMTLP